MLTMRSLCTLLLVHAGWLGSLPSHAAELSGISKIAAGYYHTCAITTGGGVKCWGYNGHGQLGDNSTTMRLAPVDVPSLAKDVTAVAAGFGHTCALTAAGGVLCWGDDDCGPGQVCGISSTQRLTPVNIAGLFSDVTAIVAGDVHTCALTAAGGVKCWGSNDVGQLGGNSTVNRSTPVDVTGLTSGVTAIAAGYFQSCAIMTGGGVKCWGDNDHGQLGDNSTVHYRSTPVDATVLTSGVTAIAISTFHACALTMLGGVKCWGYNGSGELGNNSTVDSLTPVDLTGLASGVSAITGGINHTCALTTSGGVKCWGRNENGQLGNTVNSHPLIPVDVAGLASGVTAIAAGGDHTCALLVSGGVQCWGYNIDGELGNGTSTRAERVPVAVLATVSPPVVEFYNTILDNYFITANASEALAIDNGSAGPGWTRTGESFGSGGDTAVCRFYGSQSPGPNSHFYALDGTECQGLVDLQFSPNDPRRSTVKSWNFESFDFVSARPADGQCPAGTLPVYRAYNNGFARGVDSNHRISNNQAAIAQVMARGWINEGVVMCAPA
jgi:alpha-tubulin suppressor-like RCC1 family protein